MTTATLSQFQMYVWEALPVRKAVVGREVVDDIVTLAVQQWPVEDMSEANSDPKQESALMHRLAWDVRRMMEVIYGADRFVGLWVVGLKAVLMQVLEVMRTWWHRRKDNRAKIVIWRRRWVA